VELKPADHVLLAFEAAVAMDRAGYLEQLCRLPAAHHLSRALSRRLLSAAVCSGSATCLGQLCRLSAAERLSSS
jgi:hypothetical protein